MNLSKSKVSMIAVLGAGVALTSAYAADNQTSQSLQLSKQPSTINSTIKSENKMQSMQPKNQNAGEAFLAANKNKSGVVTLPSGLQYKVITEGKGAQPAATDTVTVNYAGTLINGTEFDSSYKRGMPASFPVNGVIPGWTEALKLMKVGSTWELYIPAALAYGERGAPPSIGANQTLIFKVELLGVQK